MIDRRRFLKTGLMAGATLALPGLSASELFAAPGPLYLSAAQDRATDDYLAAVLDRDGRMLARHDLPGRGHGLTARPGTPEFLTFARRPGTFALVGDITGARAPRLVHAQAGRHFQGHGVFSPDGALLYATENDYEGERGVIGVYDATAGYRRVGEIISGGIGAHELVLMPDSETLAVGNGGILTHPDSGRTKLNLATMEPNLAFVDRRTGATRSRLRFHGERRLDKLSIRHLDVAPDGTVAVGLQDQGPVEDGLPLTAVSRAGGALTFLNAPAPATAAMRGYCGSLKFDAAGRRICGASPRGGTALFWDLRTGGAPARIDMVDGCGVARSPTAGTFRLTSGDGEIRDVTLGADGAPHARSRGHAAFRWDNHLTLWRPTAA